MFNIQIILVVLCKLRFIILAIFYVPKVHNPSTTMNKNGPLLIALVLPNKDVGSRNTFAFAGTQACPLGLFEVLSGISVL